MNTIDERKAKQLHYDVMGIALAIRGHVGESGLYQEIDAAISALDWRRMAAIQNAFDLLAEHVQALILGEMGDPDEVGRAIAAYERRLRAMLPGAGQRTA